MVHLGDQLGLYAGDDIRGAAGDHRRAGRTCTGLDERWVREWAHNQAAAKLIDARRRTRAILAVSQRPRRCWPTPDHPAFGMGMFHRLPQTMQALVDVCARAFVSGLGHDYDSHGAEGAVGIERSFEPWSNAFLDSDRAAGTRRRGRQLAVGRASRSTSAAAQGERVLLMAARVPRTRRSSATTSPATRWTAPARSRPTQESPTRRFVDPRLGRCRSDHSVDLVTTFDCIHDMTHPQEMMDAIRAAIADDGTWLLVDIKALDTFDENVHARTRWPR